MIAIDTSAVIAIALGEPDGPDLAKKIEDDGEAVLSAASYVEISVVLEGRFGAMGRLMLEAAERKLRDAGVAVVAVDQSMAELAREGFRRFGKGRHPAGLNFGDCFAYALAKALDAPLLYKGADFGKTDVKRA